MGDGESSAPEGAEVIVVVGGVRLRRVVPIGIPDRSSSMLATTRCHRGSACVPWSKSSSAQLRYSEPLLKTRAPEGALKVTVSAGGLVDDVSSAVSGPGVVQFGRIVSNS